MDEEDRIELQWHLEYFMMLLLAKLKQCEMEAQREADALLGRLGVGRPGRG